MVRKKRGVTLGSANVFKDLALKNPQELLAKAMLAGRIIQILEERKLSQTQAAKLLGVDQPKVSLISSHEARARRNRPRRHPAPRSASTSQLSPRSTLPATVRA